jgi:hypothetical protein
MGYQEVAANIPDTIQYKVCMPSFPEELREALLSSGLLERITNKKYKALIDKIHEEGPEAIEKEVEAIGRKQLIRSQTNYTLSTTRGALRTLTDLQKTD